MRDRLLGRSGIGGRNSKKELRGIEKLFFKRETFEELAQDEDDRIQEIKNKEYEEYLANYWINRL